MTDELESMRNSRDANMAEAAKLSIVHDVLVSALRELIEVDQGCYQKGSRVDKAYKAAKKALKRAENIWL